MHVTVICNATGGGFASGGTMLHHGHPVRKFVTLREAMNATLESKRQSNLRPIYIASLRQYLALFIKGREETPIADIRVDDLERWFASRNEPPVSRTSNNGRLSAMFQLSVRRDWISDNPCCRLDRRIVDHKPPVILTVLEARKLLSFTAKKQPQYLAYLVLGMFAGVRPTELLKISWDNVRFSNRSLVIDAAASKVRRRRLVRLRANCVAWLKFSKYRGARLGNLNRVGVTRYRRKAREVIGGKWAPDILRHTAASYWLAAWKDAGKVAYELGNSPGILLTHYRQLVSKVETDKFWAIMPGMKSEIEDIPEAA